MLMNGNWVRESEKNFLKTYNPDKYQKPSVTCDMIICTVMDGKLKVLLIKRAHPPYRGSWAIPGGFIQVELKETLEQAAARELQEETGLTGIRVEQLKTYGDPKRDPRMRVITVAYYALVPFDQIDGMVRAGDDAAEAVWFDMENLPKLAFDHDGILSDALMRIRARIQYVNIAFSLVPKAFTWAELQSVYEAVLGRSLVASNFRRYIKRMWVLQPVGREKNKIGRPSGRFQFLCEKDRNILTD